MRKLFATLSVISILFGSFGAVFAMAAVGAPSGQSASLHVSKMPVPATGAIAAQDIDETVKLCIIFGSSQCGVSTGTISWPAFAKIAFQRDPFFEDGAKMIAVFTDMETPPPRS